MKFHDILCEKCGGAAVLTLDRPRHRNALTDPMMQEIVQALEAAEADPEVKAVILTGAGDRAFCTGMDLRARGEDPARWIAEASASLPGEPLAWFGRALATLHDLGKPTICAVNGVAAGGGLSLALACDLRIASQGASFVPLFLERGLIPMGLTYYLPRLLGVETALRILYTNRIMPAEEALRIGLVGQVVPHAQLMEAAQALATELTRGPALALKLTRRAVYQGLDNDYRQHLAFEAWAQGLCFSSREAREGHAAFLEKRAPVFRDE
ncbi:MAG: enoyl-CoA hydratase/isomerase family protein [Chloroflexi bacterium]|nr:enoyl-CoA hydratase/isomerase family protein [Chloroflexota bacterium]